MSITASFNDMYRNKTILVFGHTGFKGSWLTLWLTELGANVIGVSLGVPTTPSHFDVAGLKDLCESHYLDIRDLSAIQKILQNTKPDFVFHLAAQALVRPSYERPIETFEINTLGTANILQALSNLETQCVAVLITSDKCYENVETFYGYRETDQLGGKDPYSASKGAAEIIIHSYVHSFFSSGSPVRIAIARAGNVVGGGDWAQDRIVPDIMRAWADDSAVVIRNPLSTRPWQHVLEPLSGYLLLGAELQGRSSLHGEPFNFGPRAEDVFPVENVVEILATELDGLQINSANPDSKKMHHEAGLLKLVCDKALHLLRWEAVLDFKETMILTAGWYQDYYSDEQIDITETSRSQLQYYTNLAEERGSVWVNKK